MEKYINKVLMIGRMLLKAGWKNAIRGEYSNDPYNEDACFSVLRYFAAEIQKWTKCS
jgi:hypothetical protein